MASPCVSLQNDIQQCCYILPLVLFLAATLINLYILYHSGIESIKIGACCPAGRWRLLFLSDKAQISFQTIPFKHLVYL